MRIAIVTAVYYPQTNGVAVFSHNLAAGLAKRGNEVIVICPSPNGRKYTKIIDGVKVCYLKSKDAKIYPDQIHSSPKKRFLFYKHGLHVSIFPKKAIGRILSGFKPEVIHIQVADPIGFFASSYARKHKIPVVTTEHNQPDVITAQLKLGLIKKPADAMLVSYLLHQHKKSNFVTMPTKKAIDDLIISRKKRFSVPIAAVSNGVDLSHFKPGNKSQEILNKYGVDRNKLTALYVGRIDPEKDVETVVESFLKVSDKLENAQLAIVGDGTDLGRLKEKYSTVKNILFLGKITPPELYDIYRIGDVFITASEIETQGIVLIEAAASGLPLIAVDAGAVSEICVDGVNGYLCKPGNTQDLARALYSILSDESLRKKFSVESVRLAHEHDFEKTLDRFMNIYEHVTKC